MVVVYIRLLDENRLTIPFQYDLPTIEPEPATPEEPANLYLFSDSRMALSHTEKQGASSAAVHETVDAFVADERVRAACIYRKEHCAEEHVTGADVVAAADAGKAKARSIYISKFKHLNYSMASVIGNLEQVTEISHSLRTVNDSYRDA